MHISIVLSYTAPTRYHSMTVDTLVRKRNAPLAGKMPGLGGVHESSSFVPVRAGAVSPFESSGS